MLADLSPWERASTILTESFTAVYCFLLGATIGSFLNVVVYRLPRGMGLLRPRSHCPHCGTPIRARDNLPILGWLLLRGRCRACQAPISARYPGVELGMGLLFLGLAYVELMSGGTNLPTATANARLGSLWTLWSLRWDLIGVYLFHALLLSLLVALALIKCDGKATPLSLIVVGVLLGSGVATFFPRIMPVAIDGLCDAGGRASSWFDGLLASTVGLVVGVAFGWLASAARSSREHGQRRSHGTTAALALVGAYLGWQAAASVALLSLALRFADVMLRRARPGRETWPAAALVAAATLVQISLWNQLATATFWPGSETGPWGLAATFASILAGAVLIRVVADGTQHNDR